MKRRFTILSAAMVLLAFLAFPLGMCGQSDYSTDYTGNITLSATGGTSASSCNVQINEVNYPGIKAGTGSVAGAMKITVPADTKYLHLHVAAWNNDNVTLTVTPEGYTDDIDLTANSGISGNSPYIFSGDPSTEDFYKVITFATALAEDTELTFTATSGRRFVVWGVTSEEGGTDPYISISGDGIAGNAVTLDYNDDNVYSATVTYSNMEEPEATDVAIGIYADAACETVLPYNWLIADFTTGSVTSIEYMAETNSDSEPRTVYMRVETFNEEETDWVPCNVIAITQLGVPTYTVTYMANGGSGSMTDENSPYVENDLVTLKDNEFTAPEGMMWDSWLVKTEDGEDVEVIEGMFEMPAKNVTVTAQWVADPSAPQYEWVLTDIEDLTASDIFVIVGTKGGSYAGSYAMSNDNGFDAAPAAVAVNIAAGKLAEIPAENLRWNISGDNTYGYTFYPNGSSITWLYCSDANNGLRVGGGEDDDPESYFTINEGYLFSMAYERYVGIYLAQDWRSYTAINSNISGQTFGFYKRQEKSTEPAIYADNVSITCEVLGGAITYTLENPTADGVLTAEITDGNEGGWLTLGIVDADVPFTCTANDGAERTATITLTYTYNTTETATTTVTVTQGAADYATLPFEYDGNGTGTLPSGLTASGLGTYSASPAMKFDGAGDYLILKLNEAPTSLSYDIKGNGSGSTPWAGTFDVMTSIDGTTYETLATYTELGAVQTVTHIDLAADVRYIKWVYTEKVLGNVAFGNIKASADYDIYASVTTENLTIPATKTCTVYSGAVLNVTASLVNEGTAANLIIEDGAQLKHNDGDVQVTMKKIIEPYTAVNVADKYYFIGLPFEANPVEVTNMLSGNYDLYAFESWSDIEWVNYKEDPENGGQFWLHAVQGYLYANDTETELVFTGEVGPALDVPYYGNYEAESEAMFNGWSLAGNPFACNAYLNDASSEEMAFYRMNEDGDGFITATGAIKPLEGIFVMATAPDQTFNFSATQNSSSRSSYLNIDLSKADRSANVVDRAIVRFSEGNMLEKFSFNENTSKLYISQGTKDYAVVRSEAQGEMPVSFKAAENGTYTLSFTNEEVTFDYLHLIDNMTGADVDLLMTPNYTFNASTSDYALRFRLVFSANSVFEGQDNVNFAYFNGSEWVINGEGTMQVIDMMGRVISSETINGSANLNVNATPGVYMIRIVNGDNVKVQKIVVR